MKYLLSFCYFFAFSSILLAQEETVASIDTTDSYLIIDSISLEGNKKTKDKIIFRELTFKVGDSIKIADLSKVLEENKFRVMNTNLFGWVKINVKGLGERKNITLAITCQEAWFIYPVPIFDLADRNFNVWFNEFNASFSRVVYGVRTTHTNLTGNADPLRFTIQLGYAPRYNISYSYPYLNKKQTLGISAQINYGNNKEISYQTENNKLKFFRDTTNFVFERYGGYVGLTYRPALFSNHYVFFAYNNLRTDDTIRRLNPQYFNNGKSILSYFSAEYIYTHDTRDIRPYPKSGHLVSFSLTKNGFGEDDAVNTLVLQPQFAYYFKLGKRVSTESILKGRYNLIQQPQPYLLNQGIGYSNDYIRGYEYYVSDGTSFAYLKNSIRFEAYNSVFNFGKYMPMKAFKLLPLKAYLTANFDIGRSYDAFQRPELRNDLTNKTLIGGGIGLDVIFYYNILFQFEYSRNQLRQNDLYLHFKVNF